MLVSAKDILGDAQNNNYAIGAFNVYNLEGVKAVVSAAEALHSPVMLQIHPAALEYGGHALVAMCLAAAEEASVSVAVHLDHSTAPDMIQLALDRGVRSIMVDGSHLSYQDNMRFTQTMTHKIHQAGGIVEAELGRISGSEDGLSVPEIEAKMTDPKQAAEFIEQTQVDMLAVCIGNVHGHYSKLVHLDFERLVAIRQSVDIPLVLHGTSGVPDEMVRQCIELGICKFNVNTEVRQAAVQAFQASQADDLLDLMQEAIDAMQAVIEMKLRLFGGM